MPKSEIQINDREIALFSTISDTEKYKSDNDKEVRLAELVSSVLVSGFGYGKNR